MKEFISLEEFLDLLDPRYDYPRSAHSISIQPNQWVQYYKCAKSNWEKFGDNGPPIGTEVITLRPGHCGSEDGIRKIIQIEDGVGGPYFVLSKSDNASLAEIKLWWLHFTI
jgi:hypothetical protein